MSITIQAEESKKEREHSMMTERKLHLFCRILWGMTAAVILMLGYASGVKSRQMTMSGGVHIRIETEQRETEELMQVSPGETIKKTGIYPGGKVLRKNKSAGKTFRRWNHGSTAEGSAGICQRRRNMGIQQR